MSKFIPVNYQLLARLIGSIFVLGLVFAVPVWAVENQFTVKMNIIGVDSEAPTTPTGLIATAISTSQIDLSWTASTDNTFVDGYRVFRDSIQIATSTVTSYSDIGLIASTSYSYNIQAFDNSFNISTSSATTTVSTLAVVVTPTSTSSGSSGSAPQTLVISGVRVLHSDETSITLAFNTNQLANSYVSWGETVNYELGSASRLFFSTGHEFTIDGLESDTTYYFKVVATTIWGQTVELGPYQVTTTPSAEDLASQVPANPISFSALSISDGILLTWRYTAANQDSIAGYRLMRSETGYPRHPYDGAIIYEGDGSAIVDRDVVIGRRYYYTLFALGANGNYSSGAVVSIIYQYNPEEEGFIIPDETIDSLIAGGTITLYQNDQPIENIDGVWQVDPISVISLRLDPNDPRWELIKDMIITLKDPITGEEVSFLLTSIEPGVYKTDISLAEPKNYLFEISGYNLAGQKIYTQSGSLDATSQIAVPTTLWERALINPIILMAGLLAIISLVMMIARRVVVKIITP